MDTVKGERILCFSTRYVGCVAQGMAIMRGLQLCLSTRYVGCVTPRLGSKGRGRLCLSTRYVGCVHKNDSEQNDQDLCLSTRYVGCVTLLHLSELLCMSLPQHTLRGLRPVMATPLPEDSALPQHTLRGLRRQKYIKYFALFCRMCCKLVDSFSVEQRMLTALTIFPDFSAAKATYVAIIDSLGRTIDRFLWCEHPVFFLLTSTSPDAHTGRCLWHLA